MLSQSAKPGIHWDELPSLRDRAADLLQEGPAATFALAHRIFSTRRAPAWIAADLVDEVLGGDPRFQANGTRWRLMDGRAEFAATPLAEMDFVVIDVEATGGSPSVGGRITELAAVRLRGAEVVDQFESLINPGHPIPPSVTGLTNITNEMVAGAPSFSDVADRLHSLIEGAVFVAHNARFDWDFLRTEFRRCRRGRLSGRSVCTLRLAKRLHPELDRKNLRSLADYYSISLESWHRAGPDARATATIFARFLDRLADRGVERWGCLERFLNTNGDGEADSVDPVIPVGAA